MSASWITRRVDLRRPWVDNRLAMPVMYMLAQNKIAVAEALGSRAMRADATVKRVVLGLVVQGFTGAWWVDSVTSFGVLRFLIKEGREAWSGEDCC